MSLKNVSFTTLLSNYPANNNLPPHLAQGLAELKKQDPKSTSCCMQACEALNKSGVKIPNEKFRSNRGPSEFPPKSGNYYLLCVDEMYNYFKRYHGEPTVLRKGDKEVKGEAASTITKPIRGLEGFIIFSDNVYGAHIELWNKINVVQDRGPSIMHPGWMWSQPSIYFWQVGDARAMDPIPAPLAEQLKGWWKVYDGQDYYYWFNLVNNTVVYTTKEPKDAKTVPPQWPANTGDLTYFDKKLEIDWDPAGDGVTRETYTPNALDGYNSMTGESNRFGRLKATKMFQ